MAQFADPRTNRRHYANKCKARKTFSVYEWLQVGRLERSQVKRGDRRM